MQERDRYHRLKETFLHLAPLAPILLLTFSAFNRETRKEIGRRDHWTCQHFGCNRDTHGGYYVQAAHFPEKHGKDNSNPNAGRILCTVHHALEEIQRGNVYGAQRLLEDGIFTPQHLEQYGVQQPYLRIEDLERMTERELLDYTRVKVPAIQGRLPI